jgi:uncharacterized membrane protein (UPF0127 family)
MTKMNKIDINDKNAALASSQSAIWRRGISTVKKFSTIFFVLLVSSACNQSPNTRALTPTSLPATTTQDEHTTKDITQNFYNQVIFVGNKKLNVQIVTSNSDMQKGLSGRNKLTDHEGMLFDFKKLTRPTFWMKDMNFDLDLIWIQNKKIIGITADVPAPKSLSGSLPTYSPPEEVDMVLEVNAGWSKANKIKIGDVVE